MGDFLIIKILNKVGDDILYNSTVDGVVVDEGSY